MQSLWSFVFVLSTKPDEIRKHTYPSADELATTIC